MGVAAWSLLYSASISATPGGRRTASGTSQHTRVSLTLDLMSVSNESGAVHPALAPLAAAVAEALGYKAATRASAKYAPSVSPLEPAGP